MTFSIIALIIIVLVIVFLSVGFYITIFGGGPFIPTPWPAVKKVLKVAGISKGDTVIDIGAGDGRFLHLAETNYGAKAIGFERDPFVYLIAKLRKLLWKWKGTVIRANMFNQDLKNADIIICYMLPKSLAKMQTKFEKELKKGTKIVSYAFHIGTLKPKKNIPAKDKISQIFLYEL